MDLMTIIGLISGAACVYYVMWQSGIAALLINTSAFILVFGGAFSCILITYPWAIIRRLHHALRMVFVPPKMETASQIIQRLVRLAEQAKRGGVDTLEQELAGLQDRFLSDGLRMVVNGLPPELIRENLEKEIAFTRVRHQQLANVFKTLGTYAPVFGLLGTLIGVVRILQNLTDPQSLGSAMAIAVTTTFYGIFGTNFIFLPIAGKLNAHSDAEMLVKEVMIEGILSVQAKEVPAIVSLKLQAYLSHRFRDAGLKPPSK
ncbi:MAG TPA: MotA/TolQ/ExbB proton channel family protein [Elusimicrobiota bacterium]|nr:MotA/TolQ/ExbB proton channel family protein [Elusimicrobiota bacterium]